MVCAVEVVPPREGMSSLDEEGVEDAMGTRPRPLEERLREGEVTAGEACDSQCPTLIIIFGDMPGNFFLPAIERKVSGKGSPQ